MPYSILITGEDDSLLQTRAMILQQQVAVAATCHTADTLLRMENGSYDLLLICYSTGTEEASRLIRAVREAFPRVKILQLVTAFTAPAHPPADATVEMRYNPKDWIQSVQQLLA